MRNVAARLPLSSMIACAAVLVAADHDERPAQRDATLATLSVPFLPSDDPAGVAAFHAWTFAGPVVVKRDGTIAYLIGANGGDANAGAWRKTSTSSALPVTITERLVGAAPRPGAGVRSATNVSVLRGERSQWRESVPAFDAIDLGEAWPGIRVTLQARAKSVEKVFTVAPGASPASIRVALDGVQVLRVDADGKLVAATASGDVAYSAPIAWQDGWRGRMPVDVAYAIDGSTYGFVVGDYDRSRPLWIDPLLQSTYLGGSLGQVTDAIAVHPTTGDVYVTGSTGSADFPAVAGGADTSLSDDPFAASDCFVARLSATLTTLIQATYFGGDGIDGCRSFGIHPISGEVYIVGRTEAIAGFPTVAGGADTTFAGSSEAFVARLPPALTSIGQATLLGGSGAEAGGEVAFHPTTGDVYIVGATNSADFPGLAGGAETVVGSGKAFVARLPASLTSITQSTLFGGTATPSGDEIVVHPSTGDVYIAGNLDFGEAGAITGIAGGADTTLSSREGYIARLNGALTSVLQSTYVGGSDYDLLTDIALHPGNGDIYATGVTGEAGFPAIAGGADTTAVSFEIFVARLAPSLTSFVQSTYVGGDGSETLATQSEPSIAIHPSSGDVYIASATDSTAGFPAMGTAEFKTVAGEGDAVVVRLNAALTSILQSALAGGAPVAEARAIAISPLTGDVYIGGWLPDGPSTLPRVAGGADTTVSDLDAWVQRYSSDLAAPAIAVPVPANGLVALVLLGAALLGAFALQRVAGRGRTGL